MVLPRGSDLTSREVGQAEDNVREDNGEITPTY